MLKSLPFDPIVVGSLVKIVFGKGEICINDFVLGPDDVALVLVGSPDKHLTILTKRGVTKISIFSVTNFFKPLC